MVESCPQADVRHMDHVDWCNLLIIEVCSTYCIYTKFFCPKREVFYLERQTLTYDVASRWKHFMFLFSVQVKRFFKFLMFPIIATGRILVFAQQNTSKQFLNRKVYLTNGEKKTQQVAYTHTQSTPYHMVLFSMLAFDLMCCLSAIGLFFFSLEV